LIDSRFIELARELDVMGVPRPYYSIGVIRDERTCLVASGEKWLVFYSERGNQGGLKEFDLFNDAKADLIARLQ
jgi:hypothetical protein